MRFLLWGQVLGQFLLLADKRSLLAGFFYLYFEQSRDWKILLNQAWDIAILLMVSLCLR